MDMSIRTSVLQKRSLTHQLFSHCVEKRLATSILCIILYMNIHEYSYFWKTTHLDRYTPADKKSTEPTSSRWVKISNLHTILEPEIFICHINSPLELLSLSFVVHLLNRDIVFLTPCDRDPWVQIIQL